MADDNSRPDIEVAKITSRQAVVVSIISVVGGIAAAMIGHWSIGSTSQANTKELQRYLVITNVKSDLATDKGSVRVVIDVNDQCYSFPSRAIWTRLGRTMTREEFPLPAAAEYAIRFSGFYESDVGSATSLISQQKTRYRSSDLPKAAEYSLNYLVDGIRQSPGKQGQLTVEYEIR